MVALKIVLCLLLFGATFVRTSVINPKISFSITTDSDEPNKDIDDLNQPELRIPFSIISDSIERNEDVDEPMKRIPFATAPDLIEPTKNVDGFKEYLTGSVNGSYAAPLNPETAEKQSVWERSGKFEGDIMLTQEQMKFLVSDISGVNALSRNAIRNPNQLWTNKIVYYTISPDFSASEVSVIETAIYNIAYYSCVRFVKRSYYNANFVNVVKSDSGCYSYVGMIGGSQALNLGSGCVYHHVVTHEFLHAVGFHHMQCTYNRDDHVRIIWDKISPGWEYAFYKFSSNDVTNFNEWYDYTSVMHYGDRAFSKDGSKTIEPLVPNQQLGNTHGLTWGDVRRINKLYSCPG